jgi:hypothetical protein
MTVADEASAITRDGGEVVPKASARGRTGVKATVTAVSDDADAALPRSLREAQDYFAMTLFLATGVHAALLGFAGTAATEIRRLQSMRRSLSLIHALYPMTM